MQIFYLRMKIESNVNTFCFPLVRSVSSICGSVGERTGGGGRKGGSRGG